MQAAAQPQRPPAAAAPPPWPGAAAQPQWPGAAAPVRSLAGGFSSLAPARPRAEKLHSEPLPTASPPAPVQTMNRFQTLEDSAPVKFVLDSGGAPIIPEHMFKLEGFIKPRNPNKKRRGQRALSSPDSSACEAAEHMFAKDYRKEPATYPEQFFFYVVYFTPDQFGLETKARWLRTPLVGPYQRP